MGEYTFYTKGIMQWQIHEKIYFNSSSTATDDICQFHNYHRYYDMQCFRKNVNSNFIFSYECYIFAFCIASFVCFN